MSGQPSPDEEYLWPGEAARFLRITPTTLKRWARAGRIDCLVTLGGHHRFSRQDVMDLAAKRGIELPQDAR